MSTQQWVAMPGTRSFTRKMPWLSPSELRTSQVAPPPPGATCNCLSLGLVGKPSFVNKQEAGHLLVPSACLALFMHLFSVGDPHTVNLMSLQVSFLVRAQ